MGQIRNNFLDNCVIIKKSIYHTAMSGRIQDVKGRRNRGAKSNPAYSIT